MRKVASLLVLVCCTSASVRAEEPEAAQKGWLSWGNGPVAQFFKGRRPSLLQRVFGEREEHADKDWQLTLRCREVLAKDKELAALNLDVTVEQCVVTLEGPVLTLELRDRAGKAIQGIKGVRSLKNQLRINVAPKTDAQVPRHFPALDQKSPVKLGRPINPDLPIKSEPPSTLAAPPAKLLGQKRNDSSWIDHNWPRSHAPTSTSIEIIDDPRPAIAHVLRTNAGFGDVRFVAEERVVWLRGRVDTQTQRDDLIRAVQGTLGPAWKLRDQLIIGR